MTGRGIDQVLHFPSPGILYEPYVKDANRYVELAERQHGPIPRNVDPQYIWGFAIDEFQRRKPDLKMINLETAITSSERHWPSKNIHYRMNPRNVDCLAQAGIDCCSLANNHVLDWCEAGLDETLEALTNAGIRYVGAGRSLIEAQQPVHISVTDTVQVSLMAFGSPTSGIPQAWAATDGHAGINLIDERLPQNLKVIRKMLQSADHRPCLKIVSIHWGANWDYEVHADQQRLACELVDLGADIVFGHSSHHVKGIQVYNDKLIIYGAGDLLTDYEGIGGHQHYRGDLGLMYFVTLNPRDGRLQHLEMVPTQMRQFQLVRPCESDVRWLAATLNREGRPLGTSVMINEDHCLDLRWR